MALYSELKRSLRVFLLFLSFYALLRSGNSLSFNISRFDPQATDMVYEGDARPNVGTIDFTSLTYFGHVGRAFYAEKLQLWDSASGRLTDFSTRFSFAIDTQNQSVYAAGLAFFLAPVGFQIPVNSIGGFLGLFNTTNSDSSSNQIVIVEFDTFANPEWDPPYEHVGINKNSIASAVTTPWNASFHSDDTADVWIVYNSTTKNLSVSWSYQTTPNPHENTSISYQIDLTAVLPQEVMIGFSAATGRYIERHQLRSWTFSSNLGVKEKQGNAKRTKFVVGLAVPLVVLLCGMVAISAILWRRKRRSLGSEMAMTSINEELARGAGPRRFAYADLASATNNFAEERKLGQGGFGAVYRGYLVGLDAAVAVKRISRGSKQGKKEFITEVKVISSLRHRNLVQLIGWCHEANEFMLVYEFMPNGSLDRHLFGKKSPLSWAARYKILVGLASALLYLHEEWEQCVVHRDIKSSNVMLDSGFNVKLGDFGLARLMDHELGPQTTGLAGTFGYMAPEYVSTGRASKESDVYSFGVVALEIATGRRSVDPMERSSQMSLVEWVWDLHGKGRVVEAVDERLQAHFDGQQVECSLAVGLWCAHPDRGLRPSIRQALQVLNFEATVPVLPNKMPIAVYHVQSPPSVSSIKPLVTNSLQEGR
ncbi:L-type lectin-domain containing receptor kinase IX.1-like [Eucalyptus grandis]|uniref:L-type lectin-domain containing receptor kinase IX.1-like n=1 Tax=Eucalyptus grandis TaxID=71139 RepID=UPI00192ED16C|nr:L-type lectin-domain containing receptor kinase IX.1-like [Eucalyptus grandis]